MPENVVQADPSVGEEFMRGAAAGASNALEIVMERLSSPAAVEVMRRVLSFADGTAEPWADHHYRADAERGLRELREWLTTGPPFTGTGRSGSPADGADG
jgi:hypothetical protein